MGFPNNMNTMKKFALLLCLISSQIFAQNNFFLPDTTARTLITNGFGGVGSGTLRQDFLNKFLFPSYIDNSVKTNTSNALAENNNFGGQLYGEFSFYNNKGSLGKNGFWGIGFGTTTEGNLGFRKELFDLIFFGNQPYAGQTLNLNNTSFNAFAYSYLQLSLGRVKESNKGIASYWVDFGAIGGHSLVHFDIPEASVYTEDLGNYLDITVNNSSLILSDTLTTNPISGLGGKINLNYSYATEGSKTLISVQNIGAISWNTSANANIDTTLRFEGIEIDDIFELSDSVLNAVTARDSFVHNTSEGYLQVLPIDFSAYFWRDFGGFINADLYLKHRLFANFQPYARFGIYLNTPIVKPGVTVAYGGYSGLQAGLNANIQIIDELKIQLGTNNVLGAIAPGSFTSMDAYAGAMMRF